MGQDCSCPCSSRCPALGAAQLVEAVNGCNSFPMHSTCGMVLLMRDLLLSKPWDGLKSIGSSIWPFMAVRRR